MTRQGPDLAHLEKEGELDDQWNRLPPPQGLSGFGRPVPLTADTGYFWFFNPANVESIVKVLDGRPVNGKFWAFRLED